MPCLWELRKILSDIQDLDTPSYNSENYNMDIDEGEEIYCDDLCEFDDRYSSIYKQLESTGFDILLSNWDKIKDR